MSYNIKTYEYDCTRKCTLRLHGNNITRALNNHSIDDVKLAAYLGKICCNFMGIVDDFGRTAAHMAASVHRYAVLEWLINHGADLSKRDDESGYTPLHRAIYYGCIDCAVLLIRYGADLELQDKDNRTALQNVCRFKVNQTGTKERSSNDILVWGLNKNYNLGIENDSVDNIPISLDYFRKEHISIQRVALGVYHSLFLDAKSNLYAVGHGDGGRLGCGNELCLTTPKKVKINLKHKQEAITELSVSRNHSIILTNRSNVYVCGANDSKQLGIKNAGTNLTSFKEIVFFRDGCEGNIKGVIAQDYHSVAFSETDVFVWGTNYGQFNCNEKVSIIDTPMRVNFERRSVEFCVSNNVCNIIYTQDNNILILYKYKMKKIKSPTFEPIMNISVVGGEADIKIFRGSAKALTLFMLTKSNFLFLWSDINQSYYRCIIQNIHLKQIDKMVYKSKGILILSEGYVYHGKCTHIKMPTYIANSIKNSKPDHHIRSKVSTEQMLTIELERFESIDRAENIFCNDDFNSFAVLQESNRKYLKIPTLSPEEYTFRNLINMVDEMDSIHDIVFHVGDETFPAHKFIIFSRATGLRQMICQSNDKDIYLNIEGLTAETFILFLNYIYSNYFPTKDLAIWHTSNDEIQVDGEIAGQSDIEVEFKYITYMEIARKFGLSDLYEIIRRKFKIIPGFQEKIKSFNRLQRKDFPELYDVRIMCSDGVALSAHKCVLVARSEYFQLMFSHEWAEQSVINLSTMHVEYMEPILSFIYSADVEAFRKKNYSETFLYNMIVYCDQYFIERLRRICELLLIDKINIKKCSEMLDFAIVYHCDDLKNGCFNFICHNMARVLQYKSLEFTQPEILKSLSEHYRNMFKPVFDYREFSSNSLEDLTVSLEEYGSDFHVDLDYRMNEDELNMLKDSAKLRSKENKLKQNSRQYELEAISSMKKSMHIDKEQSTISKGIKESPKADKILDEMQVWRKVSDKKEQKKVSTSVQQTLKTLDILKTEEKSNDDCEQFMKKTPQKCKINDQDTYSTPPRLYDLNFGDLSVTWREKLSQKQRKRLSSGSSSMITTVIPTSPSAGIEQTPNAWGILPPKTDSIDIHSPPATGSSDDPTSFANMIRTNSVSPSNSSLNSFSKILSEQRKQRECYERQRNKSLELTQIEEQAIAELQQFYNVDNTTDEVITVERKSLPMSDAVNFPVWEHN